MCFSLRQRRYWACLGRSSCGNAFASTKHVNVRLSSSVPCNNHSPVSSPPPPFSSAFAIDVEKGLRKYPKELPSKYFYDARGDELFQDVMAMPEYYLTDCEFEIFHQQKSDILEALGSQPFDLIELGAGDGTKTKILLQHFLQERGSSNFTYRPNDISCNALDQLKMACALEFPELKVAEVKGDYVDALSKIQNEDKMNHSPRRRKVVVFLGSNIGNFTLQESEVFFRSLARYMNAGDLMFTGFDLKKDPNIIYAAYTDPAGIAASLNLNILHRINNELDGHFNMDTFFHWEAYNPITGESCGYVVSRQEQTVDIDRLELSVYFDAWEAIAVKVSTKYTEQDIASLARQSGFAISRNFIDQRRYFMDSLWELKP